MFSTTTSQVSLLCRQLGSNIISNTSACLQKQNVIIRRGLRGEKKLFRKQLPQYQVNVAKLPPLTKLLTNKDQQRQDSLNNMRASDERINRPTLKQLKLEKLLVYKQYLPTNQKPVLLEALFNPDNDIDRLLRIIDVNLPTMTSFYLGLCFEVLDDMIRHGRCDPMTVAVSPELKQLCKKTIFKLRYFESDDLLKLIKFLSSLRMPEETLLVRATLQMTRHYINDFNMDELKTLSECLETIEPIAESDKSLSNAIRRAIPLATQIQLESKLYTELPARDDKISPLSSTQDLKNVRKARRDHD